MEIAPISATFAKVLPLLEVVQLDKLFDYRIPPDMFLVPGQLVAIRFHGRRVTAIVYEITEQTDFTGRILSIEKAISRVVMLDTALRALVERISLRYVGTRPDVIRLVLPKWHATAEKQFFEENPSCDLEKFIPVNSQFSRLNNPDRFSSSEKETQDYICLERMLQISQDYRDGAQLYSVESHHTHDTEQQVQSVNVSQIPVRDSRIMWILHPEQAWQEKILLAIKLCLSQSHQAIILVPTATQGKFLEKYLQRHLAESSIRFFSSAQGGKKHYFTWLEVKYGLVDIVIGMRSAIYASLPNLGLIIMFNEGDELYAEPLAPYPHTRVIAMLRTLAERCALLILGYSRTAEVQALCKNNWARSYITPESEITSLPISVRAMSAEKMEDPFFAMQRIPSEVFMLSQESLAQNKPVLIHVHLKGFSDSIICQQCNTVMHCRKCHGQLYQKNQDEIRCRRCHDKVNNLRCIACGGIRMRYIKAGAKRTAQELSQAFSGYEVIYSADDKIQRSVRRGPKLIIATSGAEPRVEGGYGTVIFLDILSSMLVDDLRAEEKTFRNIMNCMSLVEPGGSIFLAAAITFPVIRAAVRKEAEKFAQQELDKRYEVHFPPAARFATIDGQPDSLHEFLSLSHLPDRVEIMGPISLPYGVDPLNEATFGSQSSAERLLLRAPLAQAQELSTALGETRRIFGAQHIYQPVRIMVDPGKLG